MKNKKLLLGLLIGLILFLLLYFNLPQIERDAVATSNAEPHSEQQANLNSSVVTYKASTTTEDTHSEQGHNLLKCLAYVEEQKSFNASLQNYVLLKLVERVLEGESAEHLATDVAKRYGYKVAKQWISTVSALSKYHKRYDQLIVLLNNIKPQTASRPSRLLSRFTANFDSSVELEFQLTQYPDVAGSMLIQAINQSVDEFDARYTAKVVERFNLQHSDTASWLNPLSDLFFLFRLTSLSKEKQRAHLRKLLGLPLPILESEFVESYTVLKKLLVEHQLWEGKHQFQFISKIEQYNTPEFERLEKKFRQNKRELSVLELCNDSNTENSKGSKEFSRNTVGLKARPNVKHWNLINRFLCPDRNLVVKASELLQNDMVKHIGIEKLKAQEVVAAPENYQALVGELNQEQWDTLMVLLYSWSKDLTLNQFNQLAELNFLPKDATLYFALRFIPYQEQKNLLLKYERELSTPTRSGNSFFTLALGREVDFRILGDATDLGLHLTYTEYEPDPLWVTLYILLQSIIPTEKLELILPTLLNDIEINETHLDVLLKLRLRSEQRYRALVDYFPRLNLPLPRESVDMSCDK